ncbi:Outer dense fiber protein 2 [Trichoplax sp. H2]|nr:Outer dense fiber protein 2 [Trichoplax sp. H2]|eukprot:RDD45390.1 Outer dense fiber protein 2 [Trichoplax sp. H2]
MAIDNGRSKSPLHVHVEKDTPVHVHVNKGKKRQQVLRKETKRNIKPAAPTWIPPPAKASSSKLTFQSPSHSLQVSPKKQYQDQELRISDYSISDEEDNSRIINEYNTKINKLNNTINSLRSEVNLQRTLRKIDKKDDHLYESTLALRQAANELEDYKTELDRAEEEKNELRKSLDLVKNDANLSRTENLYLANERDHLLSKLAEAEIEEQQTTKEVHKLKNQMHKLKLENKYSSKADIEVLANQRELLLDKLSEFERINQRLRSLLRDKEKREGRAHRSFQEWKQEKGILLEKIDEYEGKLRTLDTELCEREKDDHAQTFQQLQISAEKSKAQLEVDLNSRKEEMQMQHIKIQNLERHLEQEKYETDQLRRLLKAAKIDLHLLLQDKTSKEKGALKKAAKVYMERAHRSQDTAETYHNQYREKETQLAEALANLEQSRTKQTKLVKEISRLEKEMITATSQKEEIKLKWENSQEASKLTINNINQQLENKITEIQSLKAEIERLKRIIVELENKLKETEQASMQQISKNQQEISQLQGSIQQYEKLLADYKSQIEKYRQDVDEHSIRLHKQEQESSKMQQEGVFEMEKMRMKLQQRLSELEPLPDLLKTTEIRFQEAQERIVGYEKRLTDQMKLNAELTNKYDTQMAQASELKLKSYTLTEESKGHQEKIENLNRKVKDLEQQNRDYANLVNKREDTIQQMEDRLDEKTREHTTNIRQYETALADARRQSEMQRERLTAKDREAQKRIIELEGEINKLNNTNVQYKRLKEEAERKCNSRLNDMKDRLEQANNTTRTMQNYVSFLKSTYSSVFGNSDTLNSTLSPIQSPLKS